MLGAVTVTTGYFISCVKIKFYWLRLKKQSVLYHFPKAAKLWVWLAAEEQSLLGANSRAGGQWLGMFCQTLPYFQSCWGALELKYDGESCLNQLSTGTQESWGLQLFLWIVCHIPMACQAAGSCLHASCSLFPIISACSPREAGHWETHGLVLIAMFLAVDLWFLKVDRIRYLQSFPTILMPKWSRIFGKRSLGTYMFWKLCNCFLSVSKLNLGGVIPDKSVVLNMFCMVSAWISSLARKGKGT